MPRYQKLALVAVVATFVMVVIGVIVRSTGSGMGCPDWPLCHGQVIPPAGDTAAWLESIHRWWGVLIGFVVLGLLIVGFQAWLGKVTVDMNNSAETVTMHLATAMILLAVFLFLTVRSGYPAALSRHATSLRLPALLLFAIVFYWTPPHFLSLIHI